MLSIKGNYTHHDLPNFINTLPEFLGKILLNDRIKVCAKSTRWGENGEVMAGAFDECVETVKGFCKNDSYMPDYTEEQVTHLTMVLCVLLNDGFYSTRKATKFSNIRSLLACISDCLMHKEIVDDISATPVSDGSIDDLRGFPDDLVTIMRSDALKEEAKRLLCTTPKGMFLDYSYIVAGVEGHCERSQNLTKLDRDKVKRLAAYLGYLLTGRDSRTELVSISRHCDELVDYIDRCLSKASCYGMHDTLLDECDRPTVDETDDVIDYLSGVVIKTTKRQVKFTKEGLDKLHVLLNKESILTHQD